MKAAVLKRNRALALIAGCLVYVMYLGSLGSLQASEDIRLKPEDFGPHYGKDYLLPDRAPYIQMKGHKRETRSPNAFADFIVKQAGWYEIAFQCLSGKGSVKVMIDGRIMKHQALVDKDGYGLQKAFTMYLQDRKHSIRLQSKRLFRYVELSPVKKPDIKDTLLVTSKDEDRIFRKGETVEFYMFGSPDDSVVKPSFEIRQSGVYRKHTLVYSQTLDFTEKEKFSKKINYRCDKEGVFEALAGTEDGWSTAERLEFCVIDTTPLPVPKLDEEQRISLRLVDEIDCADPNDPHFYRGDDQSRIVEDSSGRYRESGPGSRLEPRKENLEESTVHKGWFGYRYHVSSIGEPHIIEIDYPNNDYRKFYIILGEPVRYQYVPTTEVNTGNEYPVTGEMETLRFIIWPRTLSPDINVINVLPGSRAAISKIRVYAVDGGLPPMGVPKSGFSSRRSGWYFEEQRLEDIFYGLSIGARKLIPRSNPWNHAGDCLRTRQAYFDAMMHYGEYMRYMGMNTLVYPLEVYHTRIHKAKLSGAWPQADNTWTSAHRYGYKTHLPEDVLKLMLLVCEKFNIDFIGTFRPQYLARSQSELLYEMQQQFKDFPDPKPYLQVSRTGLFQDGDYPLGYLGYLDPLHPVVQDNILKLINELVGLYQDYPAFKGLNLTTWDRWQFIGFQSLNWGYSDFDIALFEKDTGIKVPAALTDPQRYEKRYNWLMKKHKERWIDWRCQKIEEFIKRILESLHAKRPDMKIYFDPLASDPAYQAWMKGEYKHLLEKPGGYREITRDRGFDLERLSKNPYIIFSGHKAGVPVMKTSYARFGSHMEYADRHKPTDINYKQNNGLYTLRQMYPELEKYQLPWITTGDVREGKDQLAQYVINMANNNIRVFANGGTSNPANIDREVREFMRRFRCLPDVGFTAYPENISLEPVALWTGTYKGKAYFYLANRADYPVTIDISWKAPRGVLENVAINRAIATASQGEAEATISLGAYGFEVFSHPLTWKVQGIRRRVSENIEERVKRRLDEVKSICALALKEEGDSFKLQRARSFLGRAEATFKKGGIWTGNELCNALAFRTIYEKYGYPEGIFDKGKKEVIKTEKLKAMLAKETKANVVPWDKILPKYISYKGTILVASGDKIGLDISVEKAGRYIVEISFANGKEFGEMAVILNNKEIGMIGQVPGTRVAPRKQTIHVPTFFKKGTNRLQFKTKRGGKAGIASLSMRPVYTQIRDWYVIAPFDNPNIDKSHTFPGKAFYEDGVLPPEKEIDTADIYTGWKGQKARWQKLRIDDMTVDLGKFFGYESKKLTTNPRGPKIVGYAFTYLYSPIDQEMVFKVDGLDWYLKAFMNKELVHTQLSGSEVRYFSSTLQKGWNELLIKTVTGSNMWTFNVSIADPGNVQLRLEKND